jgi:hypothetical protein
MTRQRLEIFAGVADELGIELSRQRALFVQGG